MSLWEWSFRRRRREEDLEEEIQGHLRMAAQERMGFGEPAEQARVSAIREFGNVALVKEVTREMWGHSWFETFLQDQREPMISPAQSCSRNSDQGRISMPSSVLRAREARQTRMQRLNRFSSLRARSPFR